MTDDPRAALARLVSAFERHLEVSSTRRGDDDPHVIAAYEDLADAFEEYDGTLYDAYGEMTPLDLYTGDDDEDDEDDGDEDAPGDGGGDGDDDLDDHDDEDGDRSHIYSGLDDDFDDDEDE